MSDNNLLPLTHTTPQLPDGWRWVKLKDVGRFESGGTPSKDDARYWGGKIPFVTGADITSFYVSSQNARAFLTDFGVATGKTAVCRKGTVLFVTRTRVGRAGIASETMGASQDLSPYVCGADAFPEYVCRYLLSISDRLLQNCRGATIQGLTRVFVHALEIPLPPLAEQKRIAGILKEQMAAVERARRSADAQLQAAETLPAAHLRAVFNNPDALRWPRKRIGQIAKTTSGSTPSRGRSDYFGGSIPWVKTGELCDGTIEDTLEHVTEKALEECSLPLLPAQTLLVAMYGQGQTRGRTGLLRRPMTTNQACFGILPNPQVFDSAYLQWWFRHNYSRLRQETESRGGNQPNLNGVFLREQEAQLPPLPDQQRIASELSSQMSSAERLRQTLAGQLDAINKLPAALLREAFAGNL